MKTDLQAAASRLRCVDAGEGVEAVYGVPYHEPTAGRDHPYHVDLRAAIGAWLAEHPADDGEPVDAAWLHSVGWTTYVHWPSIETPAKELLEWRMGGMWIGETPIVLATTRGDVRRLMAALKLTEGGK